MINNLQIHIPTPCHENWDAMTPEAKGRFCGSCAKVVVDFSVMTDNEVLNYLKNNKGSTCGHFTSDQLDRPIIETQLQPKRTWRYWLASIASLLVMLQRSAAQTTTAITQGKVLVKKPVAKKVVKKATVNRDIIVGMLAPQEITVDIEVVEQPHAQFEATVVDDNNQPIAFATVTTKAKIGIASTDSLGKFSIDNKYKLDSISLVVSSVGYETQEISISAKTKETQVIQLKKKVVQLPDVTVVSYPNRSLKGDMVIRVGGYSTYRRVSKIDTIPLAIAKVFKNEAFTIYPNPVNKNGTINISVKEAGNYEVQVLSNQSKLLYSQQHSTQSVKQVIQLAVPSGAVAGMYYVRLINTVTHKQWVDKLMIQ